MKVMIDIPDHIYGMVVNSGTFGCYRFKTTAAIKKGIAFSDDDTNGDVLHTLFPDVEIEHFTEEGYDSYDFGDIATFDSDWWNAPWCGYEKKKETNNE